MTEFITAVRAAGIMGISKTRFWQIVQTGRITTRRRNGREIEYSLADVERQASMDRQPGRPVTNK
jgi:predicted DNA-binding protein (UPF0251 family)